MLYSPKPMHIPDGFLSLTISIICWVISAIILSIAISRSNKSLGERQVPLMGVMAAFIFATQMINFPVAGGTSGHLLGGALAAITLGPWAGMLVMTAVIVVQGLLFQDGGLLVMGANILNMGLITVAIGYGLYRGVSMGNRTIKLTVAGIAAWLSVMAGALLVSLQLWLSKDRHPCHADCACADWAGGSTDHSRGADAYLSDAPRSDRRKFRLSARKPRLGGGGCINIACRGFALTTCFCES